ncbi:MAG: hypothetical protein F4Y81_03600 [Rhodothermaceae bacterium]|nr:hypothetical protein [Rhodothermaceae bacterium]MYG70595.1 hypothetical protein [Rhodothermaceae bacterium]
MTCTAISDRFDVLTVMLAFGASTTRSEMALASNYRSIGVDAIWALAMVATGKNSEVIRTCFK